MSSLSGRSRCASEVNCDSSSLASFDVAPSLLAAYFTLTLRVGLGGFPPRPPTEPDVWNYLNRFLRLWSLRGVGLIEPLPGAEADTASASGCV